MQKSEDKKTRLKELFIILAIVILSIITVLLALLLIMIIYHSYNFATEFIAAMYSQ